MAKPVHIGAVIRQIMKELERKRKKAQKGEFRKEKDVKRAT